MNISKEVGYPFECVGARQVGTTAQCSIFQIGYAVAQDTSLIGDSTDNTTTFCTIMTIVEFTVLWCIVVRIYPVPLIGEAALCGMSVCICPCCCASYGTVVLGFEKLCKDRSCFMSKEGLGHETNLIVDWEKSAPEPPISPDIYHQCSMQ